MKHNALHHVIEPPCRVTDTGIFVTALMSRLHVEVMFFTTTYQILFKMFCDMKDSGNIIKFKMKFGVESCFIL